MGMSRLPRVSECVKAKKADFRRREPGRPILCIDFDILDQCFPGEVQPSHVFCLLCFSLARRPRLTYPVSAPCEHEQVVFVHLLRSEHEPLINVSFDLRTSSKPAPLQHPKQVGIHLQLSKPNDTNRNIYSHNKCQCLQPSVNECLRPL